MQSDVRQKLIRVAGLAYHQLSPHLRRWLPAPLKRRLFGHALSSTLPLLPRTAFVDGPIVCVNNGNEGRQRLSVT